MVAMRKAVLATAGVGFGIAARHLLKTRSKADLRGKVVLITGGSRGLGLALARQFAAEGCRLALCARNEQELERAARDLESRGAEVRAFPCDVTDRVQVSRLVDRTTTHFGRIDVLVNNAGVIQVGPMENMAIEDFEYAMNVMFWGVVYTTLAVLPQMLSRNGSAAGRIVNITSIGGKVSVPHLLPYNCAKFAATAFSEGLRAELWGKGIVVTTIAPGLMRTGSYLNAWFKGNAERESTWFGLSASMPAISMDAARAARQIVKATKRGDSEKVLTTAATVLARAHGLFPGATSALLGAAAPAFASRLAPRREGERSGRGDAPVTLALAQAASASGAQGCRALPPARMVQAPNQFEHSGRFLTLAESLLSHR